MWFVGAISETGLLKWKVYGCQWGSQVFFCILRRSWLVQNHTSFFMYSCSYASTLSTTYESFCWLITEWLACDQYVWRDWAFRCPLNPLILYIYDCGTEFLLLFVNICRGWLLDCRIWAWHCPVCILWHITRAVWQHFPFNLYALLIKQKKILASKSADLD